MNIVIPHNWLLDYLQTEAKPEQIAEKLSLCSQSVEKIERVGEERLYHIEITPNRYDCLSVLGIVREVAAVLPRFDIKAQLRTARIPKHEKFEPQVTQPLPLEVTIEDPKLCPRFSAIVLDQIDIKPSPKEIQARLEQVGIRALNNVVDVTNYLMVDLGQPMHDFDYDKITKHVMVL
ncbi:hypothetical protein L6258_00450, partial [Candidatus Parcubacteria bacterium]|nr:hypothetical protein [Candidatus Parcubacteria bacterium]